MSTGIRTRATFCTWGLTRDLPQRFAQHNGVVKHSGGNKSEKIAPWFESHPRLGLTVVLQAAAVAILEMLFDISPLLGAQANDIIAIGEGQLIGLYQLEFGHRPPWNGMGGSVRGARWATNTGRSMMRTLGAGEDSLFVARRSLRDLVADDDASRFEAAIHAARMHAVMEAHHLDDLQDADDLEEKIGRFLMCRAGHLVDDLSASDDQIVGWLHRMVDHDAWQQYVAEVRDLGSAALESDDPRDRGAFMFLDLAVGAEPPPEHAATIAEIFESSYLGSEPVLRR